MILSVKIVLFFVFRIRLSYLGIIVCAFPSKTFNTNVSLSTIPIQVRCPWPSRLFVLYRALHASLMEPVGISQISFFTVVKCIIAKLH